MFFRRRHHHHSLVKLILIFLGLGCLCKRCGKHEGKGHDRAEMRGKTQLFRSKLREAFKVWEEEPETAEKAPETEA